MEPEVTTADCYSTMMSEKIKHNIVWFSSYLSIPWMKENVSYVVFTLIAVWKMAGLLIHPNNINLLGMLPGNPKELGLLKFSNDMHLDIMLDAL